ncbi:MAG: Gfo/Idh/MocA family oxidoreductase [Alphaproteobacteria bacterium]|nr:Gfo/Idh/MocA family oxidoreductase [Alphaproteobacteria bacterium]
MAKTLGVGIIGCGNISWAYLTLAKKFNNIEVRAVADAVMAAAEARGKEFGVPAVTVKDLLKRKDIDIVVNLTVPAVHYKVSKQILDAGKHVYSEKPLTLSYKDALALQKYAAKKKLRVGSAPDTFLGASHQLARKAIDDGVIGKVMSGTCHFMGPGMEMWHPQPHFFFQPGGGPMLDMGPYYITNLVNLLGPVKRVMGMATTARKEREITTPDSKHKGEKIKVKTPTSYHAILEFANGAAITVGLSWDVWAHKHQNMELYGQTGAMFVPDPNFFGGDVMVTKQDGKTEAMKAWDHPFGKLNWGHRNSQTDVIWANYRCAGLSDMADAIINRKKLARCDISMVAHVVEVMTAIMEAGQKKKVLTLKSTCKRPEPLGPKEAAALMK